MSAERFYGRILLAYPASYRRHRGEEMLGVLMDSGAEPSWGETLSLLRHGLALRVLGPPRPGVWREPLAVAAVLMAGLMGLWGLFGDLRAGLAAYDLRFHPDPYSIPYVDPMWVVGACWAGALVCVLLRLGWPALVVAWAGVGLHATLLLGGLGSDGSLHMPYAGFVDNVGEVVRVGPTLALAVLLSRPGRTDEGLEILGRGRLVRALGLVVAGVVAFSLVGLVAYQVNDLAGWTIGLGLLAIPVELYRRGMLLRGGLAIGLGFAWFVMVPLADGSGSRLPHSQVGLGIALGVIPLLVLPVLLLLIRNIESGGLVRRGLVLLTESWARHAREGVRDPG